MTYRSTWPTKCTVPAEPEEVESLGLTFTAGLPGIGEPVSMALCEDGDEVAVTLDNLRGYVQAYVDCILSTSVEKQVGLLVPASMAAPSSQPSRPERVLLEASCAHMLHPSHPVLPVAIAKGQLARESRCFW